MFDRNKYEAEYRSKNRDAINKKQREWYARNRDREQIRRQELQLNRTDEEKQRIRPIQVAHNGRWRQRHPELAKEIRNRGDAKLKRDIMTAYGHGRAACVRCGFVDIRALSLDHINGSGNAHRNANNGRFQGRKLYVYLRQQNYPLGYQTLCMNCQWIKRHENKEYGR